MVITRYLESLLLEDALAKQKIAFVSGPRQVGKTTLVKQLLGSKHNYFSYDDEDFRRNWSKSPHSAIANRETGLIVLDEIHKDRKWKGKLKGVYDKSPGDPPIIVTGSGRLDHFRRGSDSLLGRYLPYRLHPFTVAEQERAISPSDVFSRSEIVYPWNDLLCLGGFPEPLLAGRESEAKRWSRLRLERLVSEDSRDFLNISDLNAFRVLIDLIPERVGSLRSMNSLREDVGKAYATVRSWMQILELLYFTFTVKPYSRKLRRALKAEPKLYLYDILRIPKNLVSKRIENLAALHLLKACHYWTDVASGEFDLRFIRDKEGREVDFLILRDETPWILIECKSNQKQPCSNILRFAKELQPQYCVQLVTDQAYERFFANHNVRVVGFERFLAGLV